MVSNVAASDGIGGVHNFSYKYSGAKVHAWGRGFLGFRTVTVKDVGTDIATRTTYSQTWPTIGMPTFIEQFTPGGLTYLSQTNNVYNYTDFGSGRYFVWLASTNVQNWDLNGTPFPGVTTATEYAETVQFGNPTKVTTTTSDGFSKVNYNVYSNDTTNWILARLSCSAVTNTNPASQSQTRTVSFTYQVATGFLATETVEPGVTCGTAPAASTDARLRLITTNGYDAYGNKNSVTVSSGVVSTDPAYFAPRTTTTSYVARAVNPNEGQFPKSSTNALNQTETYEFDMRFGGRTVELHAKVSRDLH